MKNKALNTIEIYLKSSSKPVKRGNIDTHSTQIHDRSKQWRG